MAVISYTDGLSLRIKDKPKNKRQGLDIRGLSGMPIFTFLM